MRKARIYEAIVGYLFVAPVIALVATFSLIPIFQSLYYGFTDYDALQQQKFNIRFNPQEALEEYLLAFPEEVDVEATLPRFNPVEFIEEFVLGSELSERQKNAVKKYFLSRKLLEDFKAGLLDKEVRFRDFMKLYMRKEARLFRTYRPNIVGLANFRELIHDKYFWIALKNSVMFSAIVTPIQTLLALALAFAANQMRRGAGFFKVCFFIPSITSSAAISMIFMMLYAKPGLINRLLGFFGFEPVDWLGNTKTALFAIMAMNIWTTAGYFMVTFLAGLQNIPRSVMEAAELDGATGWVKFWKITVPLLTPQIVFVVTMGIIGTLQVFDQIYFLIKQQENVTMAMYIYQNAFNYGKMGYASAIAWVFFLIIFGVTLLQRRIMERGFEW